MIGLRLSLSSLLLASAFAAPHAAQDFQAGVDLLKRGQHEEALKIFQQVLASDPSHEAAYQLWQDTDRDIWLKMLVMEGQYELVAKRFLDLANLGRMERKNDPDAIRGLLGELNTDDVPTRTRVVRQLGADHGEFAVPFLLFGLADQADDDRRVIFMQALTRMGGDVVPPLIEGLDSPDAFTRRNVALTLGYIGDPRAAGALALAANSDEDGSVKSAASEALQKTGSGGDALGLLLAQGQAYHNADPSVLAPHQYSSVVWHWEGQGLIATEVPAYLYNEEMAKKAYYRALALSPGSVEALAGIARVSAAERAKVEELEGVGQDVADWKERLANDDLAIGVAGSGALDLALGWCLDQNDQVAASGLCRALGRSAASPTPNLQRALGASTSGAIRGEAAVALAKIAFHSNAAAGVGVVSALAEAAAREVVQIAAVIDGDSARRSSLAGALSSQGVMVNQWPSGARGLHSLRSIPGLDVLMVADELPDLTLHQVIDEVRRDPRTENTPIFIVTDDADAASEMYGDKTSGTVGAGGDLSAVTEAMAGNMNRDREQANVLAGDAAHALHMLAGAGNTNIGSAADALASTLAARPDSVTTHAMSALGVAGTLAHASALVGVLADDSRSDAARIHAADGLAGIFGRHAQADQGTIDALMGVATSDAAFEIRSATANALGRLNLSQEARAELMRAVRANIAR